MTALGKLTQGVRVFASDVAQGFFEITHNGFALVGLATVFCAITHDGLGQLLNTNADTIASTLARALAVAYEAGGASAVSVRPGTASTCR